MKFTHASGSTITLAADGSMRLEAKGEVAAFLQDQRGEQAAAALRARLQKVTAKGEDGDESKKWEGMAHAILKAMGKGKMTVQQVAEAIGRTVEDTEMCLKEMEAQKGVAMGDGVWWLTTEGAALAAKAV